MSHRQGVAISDLFTAARNGLLGRPGRTAMTAVGIAIGMASMILVVGISDSSRAELLEELDTLGTNLLRINAGTDVFGVPIPLSEDSPAMVARIPTVEAVASVSALGVSVAKNRFDSAPNGIGVLAADPALFATLQGEPDLGILFDSTTAELPVVVLGSVSAQRLGVSRVAPPLSIRLGEREFQVVGILQPLELYPEIDRAAIVGNGAASALFEEPLALSTIYIRISSGNVERTRPLLASTVNPGNPNQVDVSRPSDVIAAKAKVDAQLENLLLALGAVALTVGAVGIANVMIIGVVERQGEIGVRRAMGATKHDIQLQFLTESAILAGLGGTLGIVSGVTLTYAYATNRGWAFAVPASAVALGAVGSVVVGGLAGLYPAVRAGRLDPAEAVRPR